MASSFFDALGRLGLLGSTLSEAAPPRTPWRSLEAAMASVASLSWGAIAGSLGAWARAAVRWLSVHTGVPALLVAACLVVVGYRLLKKTARFALEVALVAAGLVAATEAGWIRW